MGKNTVIVGLPGQAGFEFECVDLLGDKAKHCTIVTFESLPWACRLIEFGKKCGDFRDQRYTWCISIER